MSNSSTAQSTRRVLPSLVVLVTGLIFVGAILMYATFYFGGVHGEEFSPNKFDRRSFTYHQIPLIQFQVTPVWHADETGDLERHLVKEKLVTPQIVDGEEWDLVEAMEGATSKRGEARILCFYLDALDDDGDILWLEWSKEHKQLAKVLWPVVAKVARQELYSFIPDLLLLAARASEPDELEQQINESLADKYLASARAFQQLGQHEQAIELFSNTLECAPTSQAALEGRAASYQSIGLEKESQADAARAAELQATP